MGCGVEVVSRGSKDLVKGGAALLVGGALVDSKVLSGAGAGLVVLGVMDSALNNKKGVKFKR